MLLTFDKELYLQWQACWILFGLGLRGDQACLQRTWALCPYLCPFKQMEKKIGPQVLAVLHQSITLKHVTSKVTQISWYWTSSVPSKTFHVPLRLISLNHQAANSKICGIWSLFQWYMHVLVGLGKFPSLLIRASVWWKISVCWLCLLSSNRISMARGEKLMALRSLLLSWIGLNLLISSPVRILLTL